MTSSINKETTSNQPTLVFNGEFLVTDESLPQLESGLNRVCSYLAEKSNGLEREEILIEAAVNLHTNLDTLNKLVQGETSPEKLKSEAQEKEVKVVLSDLHAQFESVEEGEVVGAVHEVRIAAILSDSVHAESSDDIAELKHVIAKGVVLFSKDEIVPLHFFSTLLGLKDFTLETDGISAIIVMHANGDITVDAIKNEHIIEGVKLYDAKNATVGKTEEN